MRMGILSNQKIHPRISKSYNQNVNGQKLRLEQLEIRMVRGQKLVDEYGEFSMSDSVNNKKKLKWHENMPLFLRYDKIQM